MGGRRAVLMVDGGYLRGDQDTPADEIVILEELAPAILRRIKGIGSLAIRYYDCLPYLPKDPNDFQVFRYREQVARFDAMRGVGITIRQGYVIKPPDSRPIQKGVDVQIAVDLMRCAFRRTYDLAVMVSNDGDFEPAIRAAREERLNIAVVFLDFGRRAKVNYRLGKSANMELKLRRKDLSGRRVELRELMNMESYRNP